jgi:hypothetical protein
MSDFEFMQGIATNATWDGIKKAFNSWFGARKTEVEELKGKLRTSEDKFTALHRELVEHREALLRMQSTAVNLFDELIRVKQEKFLLEVKLTQFTTTAGEERLPQQPDGALR